MTGFAVELGSVDRARLADHLAESRRLMTAPLERLDMCFFRLPASAVTIDNTLTRLAAALIAAVAAGKGARLEVDVPRPGRQACYVFSGFLEASRDRAAGRGWHGDGETAAAIDRIRQAWDSWCGVEGTPAERSWMRSAAAHKPQRARRVLYGSQVPA